MQRADDRLASYSAGESAASNEALRETLRSIASMGLEQPAGLDGDAAAPPLMTPSAAASSSSSNSSSSYLWHSLCWDEDAKRASHNRPRVATLPPSLRSLLLSNYTDASWDAGFSALERATAQDVMQV